MTLSLLELLLGAPYSDSAPSERVPAAGASNMYDASDHMEKKLSIEKTRFDYGLRRHYLNGDGNLGVGRYKHPRSANCNGGVGSSVCLTLDGLAVGTLLSRLRGCNPSTKFNRGFGLTLPSDHQNTQ